MLYFKTIQWLSFGSPPACGRLNSLVVIPRLAFQGKIHRPTPPPPLLRKEIGGAKRWNDWLQGRPHWQQRFRQCAAIKIPCTNIKGFTVNTPAPYCCGECVWRVTYLISNLPIRGILGQNHSRLIAMVCYLPNMCTNLYQILATFWGISYSPFANALKLK